MSNIYIPSYQKPQAPNNTTFLPIKELENGNILFFPDGLFCVGEIEQKNLTELRLDGKHKNISYNPINKKIGGLHKSLKNTELESKIKSILNRYVAFATNLISTHLSTYSPALITGRTSYRPAQVTGRNSSKRKDDTRLHVDAFPATPVNGHRILRVFSNINFENQPRCWQIGELLSNVIERFYPIVPRYNYIKARCLQLTKATKALRSKYDHYMLHIHDNMKLDDSYQNSVIKTNIEFPSKSSWIAYTDQVSHAALKGQQLLEQTFYLPVHAMGDSSTAPLSLLERKWNKR